MIVDAEIIIPDDTESSNKYLNASSSLVLNDETLTVDGQVGTFSSITIRNGKFVDTTIQINI